MNNENNVAAALATGESEAGGQVTETPELATELEKAKHVADVWRGHATKRADRIKELEDEVLKLKAKDKVAEGEAGDHFDRLDRAISSAMHEINRQLPKYGQNGMYPAAVYALAVHRGEPNPPAPTREWGQKLRHELLDTWIAEAELEERNHG